MKIPVKSDFKVSLSECGLALRETTNKNHSKYHAISLNGVEFFGNSISECNQKFKEWKKEYAKR